MTTTASLAERLLAAIAEREQAAQGDLAFGGALYSRRLRAKAELRHCAADRKLIDSVVAWPHDPSEGDPWFACAQADDGDGPGSGCANEARAGGLCDCATGAHRRRIFSALAEGYGITAEETEER